MSFVIDNDFIFFWRESRYFYDFYLASEVKHAELAYGDVKVIVDSLQHS